MGDLEEHRKEWARKFSAHATDYLNHVLEPKMTEMNKAARTLQLDDYNGTIQLGRAIDEANVSIGGLPETVRSQIVLYNPAVPEEDAQSSDMPSLAALVTLDRVLSSIPSQLDTGTARNAAQHLREVVLDLQQQLDEGPLKKYIYSEDGPAQSKATGEANRAERKLALKKTIDQAQDSRGRSYSAPGSHGGFTSDWA